MKTYSIKRREVLPVMSLLHLHPILQRVYAGRHIQSNEECNYRLKDLLHFKDLKGIEQAVHLLARAIVQQASILVVGDFDTDGATSTVLAVNALKKMGAKKVRYLVPNRFQYGYGLTPEIISSVPAADLILTVDNGISSEEGVIAAQKAGSQVLITDHHLTPETLPPAEVIVNPQQAGDQFQSKNLAGVGVIFYVMLALRDHLNKTGWFSQKRIQAPNMLEFLDLVALGTVADMVPLDRNNRILVCYGLKQLKKTTVRLGIKALAQVAGFNLADCIASDLGFMLAPRLNAAGRLQDMSIGIECLLSEDFKQALSLAQTLEKLNQERKTIEYTMRQQAFSIMETLHCHSSQASICLFNEKWHQGVTGLVANRIKDQFHRPAIVFAVGNQPGELKGSARSIPGVHIRDILANISMKDPKVLSRFGGHAAAAGLSLMQEHYAQFVKLFEQEVKHHQDDNKAQGVIETDGSLQPTDFSYSLVQLLREASPWGQGFPEPLFDGYFQVISQRLVGQKHLQMVLKLEGFSSPLKAIFFNADLKHWPNPRIRSIEAIYRLMPDKWEGRQGIQLCIQALSAIE